jgi:cytochrome c peroxidase
MQGTGNPLLFFETSIRVRRESVMTGYRGWVVVLMLTILAGTAAAGTTREDFRRPPPPAVDAATAARTALGQALFFDRRLSRNTSVACASCHLPSLGWTDRTARPFNDTGSTMARRTLPTVNLSELPRLLWDGGFTSLEALIPAAIANPAIMNLPHDQLIPRLQGIPGYRPLFEAAFPGQPITIEAVTTALAAFQRSLISARAPFDDWVDGADDAISAEARQGFALFSGRAGCTACHTGWAFTDGSFHDTGLPGTGDPGRGRLLPNSVKMQYAFRTPGLRDVALHPPYMHDGSLPTLNAVVDFYATGGEPRPSRADEIKSLSLSPDERQALVAFLISLTGRQDTPFTIPTAP